MTPQEFVDAINTTIRNHARFKEFPHLSPDVLELVQGKKYIKVVRTDGVSRSVFCFLDSEGSILKAAGWNAPAKGARGNLANITQEDIARITSPGYATTEMFYRYR